MKYGYFDDDNREYIIERPDTPAPWVNYLGSPEYGAIISNNAGATALQNPAQTDASCATFSTALTSLADISTYATMNPEITGPLPGSQSGKI